MNPIRTTTVKRAGFTLIELSVVLVIIGLLIGGVLVGRDLIKTSEIRAQISQIEEFKAATNTFRVKYGYLPGDMPPSQAAQLGFFTFTGAQAAKGCSLGHAFGNNDGIINSLNESYPFWSHLADAKMIKGSYGGTAGNLLIAAAPACNALAGQPIVTPATASDYEKLLPHSKMASAIGFVSVTGNHLTAPRMNTFFYSDTQKINIFQIYNWVNGNNSFSAYEMYQIDSKIDDGLPASGTVRDELTADWGLGTPNDDSPCTTSGVSPIKYDLSPATADVANCSGPDFLF